MGSLREPSPATHSPMLRATHTISATFTAIPSYTITASAGTGGTISPSGAVTVYSGNSQTFTITPNTGYRINTVTTDGVSRGAVNTYTFTNVIATHTISATFTNLNRNVPKSDQLLFSVVTDSLPASGSTGPWATFCPTGRTLSMMASPTVQTINSKKWEQNLYADGDGFLYGRYSTPIACNGATIIAMVRPTRNTTGTPWISFVDIFYDRLCMGIHNDTGSVCVKRNVNTVNTTDNSTATIPDGQATVLSLVVQPDGSYKVWANGSAIMNIATTGAAFTSMDPDHTALWGSDPDYTHYVNIGRNNPDGWTTFNGNIGDVFIYTIALSDTDRQTLENDLIAKFSGSTITAFAGPNGSISPSGTIAADYGTSKTFTMSPNLGYAVSDVVVDGDSVGAVSSYTFTSITASHTITAYFGVATYTITASAGPNGSINPTGTVNQELRPEPDLYHIGQYRVCGQRGRGWRILRARSRATPSAASPPTIRSRLRSPRSPTRSRHPRARVERSARAGRKRELRHEQDLHDRAERWLCCCRCDSGRRLPGRSHQLHVQQRHGQPHDLGDIRKDRGQHRRPQSRSCRHSGQADRDRDSDLRSKNGGRKTTTFFYIGEFKALGGLKVVDKTSDTLTLGNQVTNLIGYVRKPAGGEVYLELTADPTGSGNTPIPPVAMGNRSRAQ